MPSWRGWPSVSEIAGLLLLAGPVVAAPQEVTVFLKEEEAVRLAFPEADSIQRTVLKGEGPLRSHLQQALGTKGITVWEEEYPFYAARAGGAIVGRAVVVEEVGKHRPITFLVATGPEGRVRRVEVLVYRESRGGEIRQERFLRQYAGKRRGDPLRPDREVRGITGATLSVRATTRAVRKALEVIQWATAFPR